MAELREALEQALDRFIAIGDHLKPDATDDDRHAVALNWWFGMQEVERALDKDARPDRGCGHASAARSADPGELREALRDILTDADFTPHESDVDAAVAKVHAALAATPTDD